MYIYNVHNLEKTQSLPSASAGTTAVQGSGRLGEVAGVGLEDESKSEVDFEGVVRDLFAGGVLKLSLFFFHLTPS